ncbi:MAG: hypothetical protein FWC43_08750 [Planctomycetaceae bacterium]|nr:hypothetical protein [Planctomycetaceae bacterium]
MFNSAKKFIYSTCFIFLFGIAIPAWIASVKVETIMNSPPSPLADPVMKIVGNTRKFLLCRVEGLQLRDKVTLWSQKTEVVRIVPLAGSIAMPLVK